MTVETFTESLPVVVDAASCGPEAEVNYTDDVVDVYDEEELTDGRKKTRRSRRGGYRRKRQQQKKVAALIAASNAERASKFQGATACDSASTATTEGESSSGESAGATSPQRVVARKKGSVNYNRKQEQRLRNQERFRNHSQHYYQQQQAYYQDPMHPAAQQMYPYPGYGYPAPRAAGPQRKSMGCRRDVSQSLQQAQYLAMDCEMVGVGVGGSHSAVARVTLIDWNNNVVMDELVKPQWEVTDYRTFVSGITKDMLDKATMDFSTARELVLQHLNGKVLVGHALKNDLGVLGITHPWYMIRDTAKYEPYMKVRFDGCLWPRGLKDLCKEMLGRDVQVYGRPHCPKEDASAALDLYRLAWCQWEKSIDYKMRTWAMQQQGM